MAIAGVIPSRCRRKRFWPRSAWSPSGEGLGTFLRDLRQGCLGVVAAGEKRVPPLRLLVEVPARIARRKAERAAWGIGDCDCVGQDLLHPLIRRELPLPA